MWTAASTPQKFHTVAVSPLHALRKVAHSLQTCPRCHLLRLGNDVIEPAIVLSLCSVTHWGNDLRERIPWSLIPEHCYVD